MLVIFRKIVLKNANDKKMLRGKKNVQAKKKKMFSRIKKEEMFRRIKKNVQANKKKCSGE